VESLLTQLADELLVQDITEPSAVLGSLPDDDLQVFYDHVLEQFALELLIGAEKTRSGPTATSSSTPTTAPSICCKLSSTLCGSKCSGARCGVAEKAQSQVLLLSSSVVNSPVSACPEQIGQPHDRQWTWRNAKAQSPYSIADTPLLPQFSDEVDRYF